MLSQVTGGTVAPQVTGGHVASQVAGGSVASKVTSGSIAARVAGGSGLVMAEAGLLPQHDRTQFKVSALFLSRRRLGNA